MRRITRPGWKLALPLLVALSALAVASFAYSASGPNAQLVTQDRVYGGGQTDPGCFEPDINFCRPLPFNFAIDAHATGTGQAAYGDFTNGAPGFRDVRDQVTCLAVHGHNAVVGGFATSSSDPSVVGWFFAQYYVDRGTPSFGDRDLESPVWTGPSNPSDWPAGFPYVCPSPDESSTQFGLIRSFLPITHGDIVVQDGVSS
jgi:hypothetical protein